MSGVTPNVCAANMSPVRPKPVRTSSKMRSTLCRVQASRTVDRYSAVGATIPAVLQIGSTSTAATVSGFSFTMVCSTRWAAKRLASSQEGNQSRSWIGENTFTKPGIWGSNLTFRFP